MLKKILITLGVILVVLITAAATIPILFKDQIVAKVKSAINDQINAKANFGDFDLTLLSTFPQMGLKLNDLKIIGIDSFSTDTLAAIKELNLGLNLMSVINGDKYEINTITLDKPIIYAKVLKSGKANWDIMKADSNSVASDTSHTSFKAALSKYTINKGEIIYDDASLDFFLKAENVNHNGKGDFTQDLFTLNTNSSIDKLTLKYAGIPYLNQVILDAELPIDIDLNKMKFTFGDNKIKLNDLDLAVIGFFEMPNENDKVMDLKFNAEKSDLKNFLSLIPAIYANNFKDLNATGKFAVNGFAKGTYNDNSIPSFDVNLLVVNGTIKYPSLPSSINDIQIKANISNPDGVLDNTVVSVPSFHLKFGQAPLDGKLLVKNLISDPFLDVVLKGGLDLNQLTTIFPIKDVILKGELMADLQAAGRKSSIDKGNYQDFKASGQAIANNFIYTGKEISLPIEIPSAKLTFNPKNITLSNITAKIGKSDLSANGTVDNYLNYVFKKNALLEGSFKVNSNYIDINEMMGIVPQSTTKSEPTTITSPIQIPGNIDFNLAVDAKKIIYDNFNISDASGSLFVKDKTIQFKNMILNMLAGRVKMNGSYSSTDANKPKVDVDFGIEKMDIQQAFGAINTIKLLAPIAQYTKGSFSTQLNFKSDLDQTMKPIYGSLNASGLANIIQAVVDGFEPINKLASTLGANDLKKLEINNAIAKFNITNGRINISPFDVKIKDVLMNVQGSNGIDQSMNYNLNLNIPREMLGSKANELANNLIAGLNNKLGTQTNLGDKIKLNAVLGGTFTKPTIALKGASSDGVKSEITSTVKNTVNQVVEEKKVEIQAKAQEKIDTLKKEAKEKVTNEIKNKLNNLLKKKNDGQ